MNFKIDKNIPIPAPKHQYQATGAAALYESQMGPALRALLPGESVAFPKLIAGDRGGKSSIVTMNMIRKCPALKFTYRIEADTVRIWRVK
jgi:hypothetical protein